MSYFPLSQKNPLRIILFLNHCVSSFSRAKNCHPKKVRGHGLSFLVIKAGSQKVGPNDPQDTF